MKKSIMLDQVIVASNAIDMLTEEDVLATFPDSIKDELLCIEERLGALYQAMGTFTYETKRKAIIDRYFRMLMATVNRVFHPLFIGQKMGISTKNDCLRLAKLWKEKKDLLEIVGLDIADVTEGNRRALEHLVSLAGYGKGDYPNDAEYAFGGGCETWQGDLRDMPVDGFSTILIANGYKLVELQMKNVGLGFAGDYSIGLDKSWISCKYILTPEAVELGGVWYDLGQFPKYYDFLDWIGEAILIDQFPDVGEDLKPFIEYMRGKGILQKFQRNMEEIDNAFK